MTLPSGLKLPFPKLPGVQNFVVTGRSCCTSLHLIKIIWVKLLSKKVRFSYLLHQHIQK